MAWKPNEVGLAMLEPDDEQEKIQDFRKVYGRLPTDAELKWWREHDVTQPIEPDRI